MASRRLANFVNISAAAINTLVRRSTKRFPLPFMQRIGHLFSTRADPCHGDRVGSQSAGWQRRSSRIAHPALKRCRYPIALSAWSTWAVNMHREFAGFHQKPVQRGHEFGMGAGAVRGNPGLAGPTAVPRRQPMGHVRTSPSRRRRSSNAQISAIGARSENRGSAIPPVIACKEPSEAIDFELRTAGILTLSKVWFCSRIDQLVFGSNGAQRPWCQRCRAVRPGAAAICANSTLSGGTGSRVFAVRWQGDVSTSEVEPHADGIVATR